MERGKGGETMTGVEAGYVGNLLFAVTARASLVDVVKGGNERRENLLDSAQQKLNSPVYSPTRFASFQAWSSREVRNRQTDLSSCIEFSDEF